MSSASFGSRGTMDFTKPAAAAKSGRERPKRASGSRVAGSRVIVRKLLPPFSRQLAAMLSAGIPIVGSLEALLDQADHPHFKAVIAKLKASIENGAALSEALRQFPTVFDNLYCNMVRGGETGGQLPETISRLAAFLEAAAKVRRKVASAMTYPAVILCLAVIISIAMIIFIVPVFGEMYAEFDKGLPAATQGLLNVSEFLKTKGWLPALITVGLVIAYKQWYKTPGGAMTIDSLKLRIPVMGDLLKKLIATRFARMLGEMIACGVPILTALDITAGSTGNYLAESIIRKAKDSVEKGEPLSNSLTGSPVFPLMIIRMLQAGEKTGRIDEMMVNIADFYDDEIETMLAGLTSLLEPILMVIIGVMVGSIVLCMFMPIFKLAEVVSG